MRTAYKIGFFVVIVLIHLLLVKIVNGASIMEVSTVKGEMVGSDVKHDFSYASLKVSPENAITESFLENRFTQTIDVKNTHNGDLYLFFDPYFDSNVKSMKVYELTKTYVTVPRLVQNCNLIVEQNGSWQDCNLVENGTMQKENLKLLEIDSDYKLWGQANHYPTRKGIYVPIGETRQFRIKYETVNKEGKWNARIWANTNDDWTCILDENQSCLYDYTIDPTFSGGDPTATWQFNEGSGTTTASSTGSWGNGNLTGTPVWVGGIYQNALRYDGANSYTSLPTMSFRGITVGSLNVWIMNNQSSGVNREILAFETTAGSYTFRLGKQATHQCYYQISGTFDNCPAIQVWSTRTEWSMYTLVWNTTEMNLFINGSYFDGLNASLTGTGTNYNWWVARSFGNGYYNGTIDELYVWNGTKLSASQSNELWNGGSGLFYPFTSITVESINFTWTTPAFETGNYNFVLNVTWNTTSSNITNVSSANLTYNNINYVADYHSGNANGSAWNVTLRPDLTSTNNTARTFNWSYHLNENNGSVNRTNTTNNGQQNVIWAYYPINIAYSLNETESDTINWTINTTFYGSNTSGVSFVYVSQWNLLNLTGTFVANATNQTRTNYTTTAPMLGGTGVTPTNQTFNITGWLNLSFNGTSLSRDTTLNLRPQTINRMIITDCLTTTNILGVQYYIRDAVTNNLIETATTSLNTIVYKVTPISDSRNWSMGFTSNSSPTVCRLPSFGSLFLDFNATISATEYTTNTFPVTGLDLDLNTTHTFFLINSSGTTTVLITLTDQNDNELTGYTIEAYFLNSSNATPILVDDQVTNLQGQVQFGLPINGTLWAFIVKTSNGTTLKRVPITGGTTIIATSFTIKVILDNRVSLLDLLLLRGISHNLTYDNNTFIVNLSFDDSRNITLQNCLRIMNITNSNQSTLSNQCTTSRVGNFSYNFSGLNGSYVAQYRAQYSNDSLFYLIDDEYINLQTYPALGREGILMAFILIGTMAMIGVQINPTTTILLAEVGFVTSWLMGLLPISWYVVAGIIFAGLAIAYGIHKEAL